jgi:lipopolysaccharide export system permease protein
MLPPVLTLSFLGFLVALLVGVYAVPWGNKSFNDLIFQVAQSQAELGIKERVFSEPFDNVVFYVNSFSQREKVMRDVFVVDRRDRKMSNTIIAKEGRIFRHPEQRTITVRFVQGAIFVVEETLQSARTIEFKTYDLTIGLEDIMASLASNEKKPNEMFLPEILEELESIPEEESRHKELLIKLLEKFTIPLSVFLMGIIGVPLGAQLKDRGRSAGIGVSLVVFLLYYVCLAGVRDISETGAIPPFAAPWIPVLFLLTACFYFLRRAANERKMFPSFAFLRRTKKGWANA